MSDIDLDIPAFLVIPAADRKAAWKGRRLTDSRGRDKRHPWHLPKDMTPECWRMLRAAEAAREAKKQERLAALRALR